MRILSINIYFGEGSTGKILEDIHTRLERDAHESYIVYGLGTKRPSQFGKFYKTTSDFLAQQYRRIARLDGLKYNTAFFETKRLIKHIQQINPDIVHLHCLNCGYIEPYLLLRWLGKHNYKVLVTHHADVTITANCEHAFDCQLWKTGCKFNCANLKKEDSYKFFTLSGLSWKQMFNAFNKIHNLYATGVSEWMADRVKQSPFFHNRECRVIENGLDTSTFHFDPKNINIIIEDVHKTNRKVVLHVTPSLKHPLKGGKFIFELARRLDNVVFIIVGTRDEKILNIPSNVILIPHTDSKKELASYYQASDVTLLTSKKESFSMVTAESQCCGTPVVGFKAGAPETIAIQEYSEFVDYGDINTLEKTIKKWLSRRINKEDLSSQAILKFDAEIMYQKYLSFYNHILGNN